VAGGSGRYDVTLAGVWRDDRPTELVSGLRRGHEPHFDGGAGGLGFCIVNQQRAGIFLAAHRHFRRAHDHFTVTVTVQVTDRGPRGEKRVIDISLAAAQALHMQKKGVTRVRLEAFQEDQAGGGVGGRTALSGGEAR